MNDYFYAEEAEQFVHYRIPKALMTEGRYDGLSSDAKILYGLCLDRIGLSRMNGWVDEGGRVYIFYTVTAVEKDLRCAVQKAVKLLKELETYGLIERKKRGQGRPDRIYVKKFIPAFRKSKVQDYGNQNSVIMKIKSPDFRESKGNKNKINNTDGNPIYPIPTDGPNEDEREKYRAYFKDRLSLELLSERYPEDRETITGIGEIILDTVSTTRQTLRIMGEEMSSQVVKSRLMKLNSNHIEYVLDRLEHTTTKIRNIRQYLLAALYNAPATIGSYYQQEVRHDLAHPGEAGGLLPGHNTEER